MEWRAGQKVLFRHTEGGIPAEIVAVNADGSQVRLRIEGWLGLHWEPATKISRAP